LNFNISDGSYNVNISGSVLESAINSNTTNITTLLNKVDYEIREIHAMQSNMTVGKIAEFPPGIFQLYSDLNAPNIYTKTEVNNIISPIQVSVNLNSFDLTTLDASVSSGLNARYTKTETDTLLNSKQSLLNSGNTIYYNVGRGGVYCENNSYDNVDSSINSSGLTFRALTNPVNSSIFAVRSSANACRLWVGQNLTSTGDNNFGICASSSYADLYDETVYKHLFKANEVKLTGPVNVTGEIKSGDARFYEYDAGIYKVLNLVHDTGINLAVSSNTVPTSSEILLSMDTTGGVTINTSGYIQDNLGVGGNVNITGDLTVGKINKTIVAFDCYNSGASSNFTTGTINVNLNTVRYNSGEFSLANDTITVNEAMTAQINFRVSTDISSGSSRSISRGYLNMNGSFVAGSNIYIYNRQITQGENTASACLILDLAVGDTINIKVKRHAGNDTLTCIGASCAMTITKL